MKGLFADKTLMMHRLMETELLGRCLPWYYATFPSLLQHIKFHFSN
jgi:hypothetical protein